jgi:hypothetical protein
MSFTSLTLNDIAQALFFCTGGINFLFSYGDLFALYQLFSKLTVKDNNGPEGATNSTHKAACAVVTIFKLKSLYIYLEKRRRRKEQRFQSKARDRCPSRIVGVWRCMSSLVFS